MLLPKPALSLLTTNFKKYSRYYDLLYQDKDYQGEAAYINRHIQNLCPDTSTLLELGAGTGNHAFHLCSLGYKVTGIERSVEMVDLAKAKQIPDFLPLVHDITNFDLSFQFDAAVCLFHSICYLTTNAELQACFTNVSKHLKPGGLFVFDIWYAPAVLHQLPGTSVRRKKNESIEILRIAETAMFLNKNIAEVKYQIIVKNKSDNTHTTIEEIHPMRYLSIPEIELFAELAGFKLIRSEEFMNPQPPTINSWNVLILLQKTANE